MSKLQLAAVGAITAAGVSSSAFAGGGGAEIELSTIVNPTSLATAAATLGGAGLIAAFTLGGGFRIAKKVYAWIFSKM